MLTKIKYKTHFRAMNKQKSLFSLLLFFPFFLLPAYLPFSKFTFSSSLSSPFFPIIFVLIILLTSLLHFLLYAFFTIRLLFVPSSFYLSITIVSISPLLSLFHYSTPPSCLPSLLLFLSLFHYSIPPPYALSILLFHY